MTIAEFYAIPSNPYLFPFGPFRGQDMRSIPLERNYWTGSSEVSALSYLSTVLYSPNTSPRHKVVARRRLIEAGELVRVDGRWVKRYSFEHMDFLDRQKRAAAGFPLEGAHGHFGKQGERVSLEAVVDSTFSFNTPSFSGYGTTATLVVKFLSRDGKLYTYKGAVNHGLNPGDVVSLQGVVKHGEYKGKPVSYLQRVKVEKKL